MNNRKSQNSIIVLATLGVYLGLVLAGAAPQVLAQAAMTRQFDVKDEIEVRDDLDNKPDRPFVNEIAVDQSAKTKSLVSDSVSRFLLRFDPVVSSDSLIASVNQPQPVVDGFNCRRSQSYPSRNVRNPLTRLVTVSNFARASLDPLLS
ncbi:MAG: hypothetical protein ABIV21_04785 [Pyrinomonadaceae bacterium]